MTERELQILGFKINYSSDDQYWQNYHYYTYKIADGLSLISNASDAVKENEPWYVEIFNVDPEIRFNDFGEVQALINHLESRLIKPFV